MDGSVKDGLQYTHRFVSQSDIAQPIPNNHVRNLADQFQYAALDKASRVTDTVQNLPDRIGEAAPL
jgi:hypothetical protein